jgi:hypothetical protein
MKKALLKLFGKSALPALALGTILAVTSPVTALAQSRGGHGGGSPSAGRSYGGHAYVAPHGAYHSGPVYGYRGGYYGYGYHGPVYGYPGVGFSFSFGAPYYYPAYPYVAPPPPPPPCGYYDQGGYFHPGPCAPAPGGYVAPAY